MLKFCLCGHGNSFVSNFCGGCGKSLKGQVSASQRTPLQNKSLEISLAEDDEEDDEDESESHSNRRDIPRLKKIDMKVISQKPQLQKIDAGMFRGEEVVGINRSEYKGNIQEELKNTAKTTIIDND